MRTSIKGIAPEWYTLEVEREKPDPAQFYLKPLDGFESMEIQAMGLMIQRDGLPASEVAQISSGIIKRAFQLGVKDWRNIEDAKNPGSNLKFSAGAMPSIRSVHIMEVGARVLEISEINEAEAKNSDSPPSSPST